MHTDFRGIEILILVYILYILYSNYYYYYYYMHAYFTNIYKEDLTLLSMEKFENMTIGELRKMTEEFKKLCPEIKTAEEYLNEKAK